MIGPPVVERAPQDVRPAPPRPPLVIAAPPLLVGTEAAARICGLSGRTWRRLASAGAVPRSLRLGSRKLWRVEDLAEWVSAGCPSADRVAALQGART